MATIHILDEIGASGVTLASIIEQLKLVGPNEPLNIIINSPGGDVFEGVGIYDALKSHQGHKTTTVQGIAASIASVIFLAGDTREVSEGSFVMIHDPFSIAMGTADDLRKNADVLDKIKTSIVNIYSGRTNQTPEAVADLMTGETWLNETEAVALGFATQIAESAPYSIAAKALQVLNQAKIPAEIMAKIEGHAPAIAPEAPVIKPEEAPQSSLDTEITNKIELSAIKNEVQEQEIGRLDAIKALAFEGCDYLALFTAKMSPQDALARMYDELKVKYAASQEKIAELEAKQAQKMELQGMLETLRAAAAQITVPQITEREDPKAMLAQLSGVARTKYYREKLAPQAAR